MISTEFNEFSNAQLSGTAFTASRLKGRSHTLGAGWQSYIVAMANELIRREIDRYCAWLAWITCDPTSGALEGTAAVVQDANTIIALRTWESQLQ